MKRSSFGDSSKLVRTNRLRTFLAFDFAGERVTETECAGEVATPTSEANEGRAFVGLRNAHRETSARGESPEGAEAFGRRRNER